MKDYNEHMLNDKSDTVYELHDQDLQRISAGICMECYKIHKKAVDSAIEEASKYQGKPVSLASYLEHSNKAHDLRKLAKQIKGGGCSDSNSSHCGAAKVHEMQYHNALREAHS